MSTRPYRAWGNTDVDESAMSWRNPATYPFSQISVSVNAPEQSGVYALYNGGTWVYVGESADIRARLTQHLNGDNPCITVYPTLTFSYELVPAAIRAWRHDELIREFHPLCSPRSR